MKFRCGKAGRKAKTRQPGTLSTGLQGDLVRKLSTGWVLAAGLAFVSSGAHAQVERAPSTAVSDVGGPTAAVPKDGPRAGGPMLLPPMEVYTVVRESGFSPLGIPQRRG